MSDHAMTVNYAVTVWLCYFWLFASSLRVSNLGNKIHREILLPILAKMLSVTHGEGQLSLFI